MTSKHGHSPQPSPHAQQNKRNRYRHVRSNQTRPPLDHRQSQSHEIPDIDIKLSSDSLCHQTGEPNRSNDLSPSRAFRRRKVEEPRRDDLIKGDVFEDVSTPGPTSPEQKQVEYPTSPVKKASDSSVSKTDITVPVTANTPSQILLAQRPKPQVDLVTRHLGMVQHHQARSEPAGQESVMEHIETPIPTHPHATPFNCNNTSDNPYAEYDMPILREQPVNIAPNSRYPGTFTINPLKGSNVPNLMLIRPAAPASIAAMRCPTPPHGISLTRPFPLDPPPYTDADIPLPQPYNSDFPHPITVYASPGVNPKTLQHSGYDMVLAELMETNPKRAMGDILASSEREGLTAPALAVHVTEGDGNGIPERLWSKFDSLGAARLAVGVPSPFVSYARSSAITPSSLPPRFQGLPFDVVKPPISPLTPGALSATELRSYHMSLSQSRPIHRSNSAPQIDLFPGIRQMARRHSEIDHISAMEPGERQRQLCPHYKTELCPYWQADTICKYDDQCQFAHGYDELRSSRVTGTPPTFDLSPAYQRSNPFEFPTPPDTPVGHVEPRRTILVPSATPLGSLPSFNERPDLRRAYMPPTGLCTVQETEDDTPVLRHTALDPVAPIGSERCSPSKASSTTKRSMPPPLSTDPGYLHPTSPSMPAFQLSAAASIHTSPLVCNTRDSISTLTLWLESRR
ncbi:hypothetical protein TREMEDRAFT_64766 [Tremella mesenterica DSM 1558]|uniref:uncharacterized protein n=1 Tax=Tremella mesenterica (strain ATCC 24925 / CBS 8224 / DSM 1558 / NBRC 9311 / NRRL Y-6157 / RJB 2259-6 / UBC 559-6) TaxID=578456 RepID=UPI0003F49736|nr:uncharacterized protein TREMEDRAFT_64766 [Tremella mesenterica DSM 1558]EIW66912.1 hypothetical protein TREMEDRAFT_64766 [Tremella mesenterica DSM 1558]